MTRKVYRRKERKRAQKKLTERIAGVYMIEWFSIFFPPAFDFLPRDASHRITKSVISSQ